MTQSTYVKGSLLSGEVSSLAFGGQGIIKKDGFVVFVPFTAPEDVAIAELTKVKKNYGEGLLKELISSSPLRVTPRCPYFGVCGGCQLQHINYEAELASKQKNVGDALKKVYQGSIEIEGSDETWGYRQRIRLHLINGKIGYFAADNRTLLEINECAIFLKDVTSLFENLRKLAVYFKHDEGQVDVLKDSDGRFIVVFHFKYLPTGAKEAFEMSKNFNEFSGFEISSFKNKLRWGLSELNATIENLSIFYTTKVFIQNNREVSQKILKTLLSWIEEPIKKSKLLDLYCGIGVSSLLLAQKGYDVMGIESNVDSIELARKNAKVNQLRGLEFYADKVEKVLASLTKNQNFQCVFVNPPREGLFPNVVETLLSIMPNEIFYLSCMPSTLARDLGPMIEKGYRVEKVKAFDMFPKTGHIETLLHLKKFTN